MSSSRPEAAPVPAVTVHYWAAAKEAAGRAQDEVRGATLAEVLAAVRRQHGVGSRLTAVLERSSYIVDEKPAGRRDPATVPMREGSVVEVLPPFAGG